LAAGLTVATLVATLAGSSAFAESRPQTETRPRSEGEITVRGDRDDRGTTSRRGDESRTERRGDEGRVGRRAEDQQRADAQDRDERGEDVRGNDRRRDDDRSRENRGNEQWRDQSRREANRGGSYDRNRSGDRRRSSDRNHAYRNREPYRAHGRVSRVVPYRGGYHVWIGGAPYPFFVPSRHYNRNRFRIGVVIGLGGYYNPLGYYDYYDDRYSDDRYYGRSYRSGSTRAEMSGTVESVDYRRYTFVMRNDATGSFVTIHSRDRNVDIRPGDYVEVRGNWRRSGLFEAYDVDLLD
jgi:hypothetical protein